MNGMAGRDRRGDAVLRAFARDLAKMRRDLRNLEAANQISSASIEGGTLDVYDDADVLRERIGKQANGSYGRLVLEGPPPPIPSEPDVQVISDGVVAITWDGRCEEKWPFVEFRNVRIHLVSDPVNEVCDRDNQVGAIFAHRGGTIVAVTESDDDNPVYARLVAVSSAGHVSDPSPAVLVDELDEEEISEDEEQLEWEDGDGRPITQAEVDAGEVVLSLSHDPEVESLTAVLAGAPQRPTSYSIDFDAQTLTLSLSGWEKAGDVLWVHYPYYAGEPIPLDVWFHWTLDEASGTTWADSGPYSIDLTASAATLGQPPASGSGHSATFNGASSYGKGGGGVSTLTDIMGGQTDVSWGFWIKTTQAAATFFSRDSANHTPAQDDRYWSFGLSAGKLSAGIFNDAGANTAITSPAAINDGAWHRCWVALGDGTLTMFIDGAQVAEIAWSSPVRTGGLKSLTLGAGSLYDEPDYNWFAGSLDDVMIVGSKVTLADVQGGL